MSDDLKLIPSEWAARDGIKVIDPDGWREGAPLGARDWGEPITHDEYVQRVTLSTTVPVARQHDAWLVPSYWEKAVAVDALELGAVLRRARIVDAAVIPDPEVEGVSAVLLEIHHDDGRENWMLRLAAHGDHTEGWVVAEVRHA